MFVRKRSLVKLAYGLDRKAGLSEFGQKRTSRIDVYASILIHNLAMLRCQMVVGDPPSFVI